MTAEHCAVILWDFDGTLAHRRHGTWAECVLDLLDIHEPDHRLSFTTVFDALATGFPWHTPDRPHPHLADPREWWASVTAVIEAALAAIGLHRDVAHRVAAEVRTAYTAPDAWSLYPAALDVLDTLHDAGWRHVLVSNHVPELPTLVTTLGLRPRLEALINSAETGYEKPHPAVWNTARRITGNARLWMVGDNPAADVAGARRANIDAIWTRRNAPGDLPDLPAAARVILEHPGSPKCSRPCLHEIPPTPVLASPS